jgi:aminoglycoside phosphotransferase (APT) family kinase protein
MAMVNSVDADTARGVFEQTLANYLDGVARVEVTDVHLSTTSGMSAETVLFNASWHIAGHKVQRDLVARVAPRGPGLFYSYDLDLEAHVMDTLRRRAGVPVPEVLCYQDNADLLGAPFFIMERLAGRTPADDPPFTATGWLHDLPPEQKRLALDNALAAMASVHRVNPVAVGLDDIGRYGTACGDPLGAHIEHWEKAFAWASDGVPNPYVEAGFDWVRANRPVESEPRVISWGDARIANVVFAEDLSVSGIIDWEMVCLGSPELDLGWWFATLRLFSDAIGIPLPDGFPTRQETVCRYEALTGFDVKYLQFYEAFAYVRLSVAMIRAARMLIAGGALPPDAGMEFNNPATRLLAEVTGVQSPTEDSQYFIGNRH